MGDAISSESYTPRQRTTYRRRLEDELERFDRHLQGAEFVDHGTIGLELELNLVDDAMRPHPNNQAVLARWYGGALTTGLSIEDIRSWPDRIRAVTAEQVRAVAQKWLEKKRSVTGYLIKDTATAKREEKRS